MRWLTLLMMAPNSVSVVSRMPMSEVSRCDLEAGNVGVTPHLHYPGAIIERRGQPMPFVRFNLGHPAAFERYVITMVAGLAHAKALRCAERPRWQRVGRPAKATVLAQPCDRLGANLIAAAGPYPNFSATRTKCLHCLDDWQVRHVVDAGSKKAAPVWRERWPRPVSRVVALLDPAALRAGRVFNKVAAMLDQRQRAIEIEDV